jgi:hypothetical protein
MCFCPDKNDLAQHMAGNETVATPVLESQTKADVLKILFICIYFRGTKSRLQGHTYAHKAS